MKIKVILIDERNGKWGWIVSGEGFKGGGNKTANTKDEAEEQAKVFVGVLIKTEKVNMATDTIIIVEGSRKGET